MRPIRFQLRTIMIVVAVLAMLMGAQRALTGPFFDNMIVFTATVVFLAAAAFGFLLVLIYFLVAAVVHLLAFAVGFCRGRTRLLQFISNASRLSRGPEPSRN